MMVTCNIIQYDVDRLRGRVVIGDSSDDLSTVYRGRIIARTRYKMYLKSTANI